MTTTPAGRQGAGMVSCRGVRPVVRLRDRSVMSGDHPECVSPTLGAFGRALNDRLPEHRRQELIPFIPRLIGTAGDGKDRRRWEMVADFMARDYAARLLDQAELPDLANQLRALTPIKLDAADVAAAAAVAAAVVDAADAAAAVAVAVVAAVDAAVAAVAAAAAAAAADADAAAGHVVYHSRRAGYAAMRVIAFRAIKRGATWTAARKAASEALAPTVEELQTAVIKLYGDLITAE